MSRISNEVINLNSIKADSYSIIDAFICADAAQGRLDKYKDSAASLLYDLAISIWAKDASMTPSEVLEQFNSDLMSGISKHVAQGNLTASYEKEHKNMIKAFNKIRNALKRGLDIRTLGSTHACEKAVTNANKAAIETAEKAAIEAQVSGLAEKQGITKDEAREKLRKAGVVDVVTSNNSDETGAVRDNQGTVLQDSNESSIDDQLSKLCSNLDKSEVEAVIEMLSSLDYVMHNRPDQGKAMLNSWQTKANSAKASIMSNLIKPRKKVG